jgi:hypothetical protein
MACPKRGHFLRIFIDTDHTMSKFGETEGRNQTHISGTYNHKGAIQIHFWIYSISNGSIPAGCRLRTEEFPLVYSATLSD